MFHWLFPNWSNPALLAATVGIRILLNCGLVAVVASSTGRTSVPTIYGAIFTPLSAGVTVLILRPGVLGLPASYFDLLGQLVFIVIAGYAVFRNRTRKRLVAFAVVGSGATLLMLWMVPVYGEALVAP